MSKVEVCDYDFSKVVDPNIEKIWDTNIKRMKISYGITVHNEVDRTKRLLRNSYS